VRYDDVDKMEWAGVGGRHDHNKPAITSPTDEMERKCALSPLNSQLDRRILLLHGPSIYNLCRMEVLHRHVM